MKHLHVISFQNPTPPDYGGVIDVYYKLKALHDFGWAITLHTYCYERQKRIPDFFGPDDKVIFYDRKSGFLSNLSLIPYIVNTRNDSSLLENLNTDKDPILFEGLHTCMYLAHPSLSDRIKIVRAHNVEHDYYRQLAKASNSFKERIFFNLEALRLKYFEKILGNADIIASISANDYRYFSKKYPECKNILLPCFFDNTPPSHTPGDKDYVLYQGNLSVKENEKSALRIIRNIASALPDTRFILSGKNPSAPIIEAAAGKNNVKIIANPSNNELDNLITDARINLLITHQATGIKLKLLNALCRGAHAVVNTDMISGTGLEEYVTVAETDTEIINAIKEKIREPFASARQLPSEYSNTDNIRSLISIL